MYRRAYTVSEEYRMAMEMVECYFVVCEVENIFRHPKTQVKIEFILDR